MDHDLTKIYIYHDVFLAIHDLNQEFWKIVLRILNIKTILSSVYSWSDRVRLIQNQDIHMDLYYDPWNETWVRTLET